VLAGLAELGIEGPFLLVHGSTVATNAFLERKGARVTLVTTAGFEDVIEIGRQSRLSIYDLRAPKPEPLVPPERRVGLRARVDADGHPLVPLTDEAVAEVVARVRSLHPEAVAVVLLHADRHPEHERRLGEALKDVCPVVYLSSTVNPEHREYERTSTTVLTAYVAPTVGRYLRRLESRLGGELRVMSSAGGHASVDRILEQPAAMMLSGPAGGVVGALAYARRLGHERIVTFDMGGTSTDVALVQGETPLTREAVFDGLPLRLPMVDVHTVGAGGGSIARLDLGGSLTVGPESAGARPGPAAYGLGGREPTVTDANLVLGRLDPDRFLGGRMRLRPDLAEAAVGALAAEVERRTGRAMTVEAVAEGIVEVVSAAMERAIRRVTARRGVDPAGFALVSFGGAGGLHAALLARRLGIRTVLVPPSAGTLCAVGLALSGAVAVRTASLLRPAEADLAAEIEAALERLVADVRAELAREGHPAEAMSVSAALELRYRGESYELETPWQGNLADTLAAFHRLHAERYLHADPEAPVECVNAIVRGEAGARALPPRREHSHGAGRPAGERTIVLDGRRVPVPTYEREGLPTGFRAEGPALLFEMSSTILVPAGARFRVGEEGVLVIDTGAGRDEA
jgi:N-methylhydantoinase A